MTDLVLIIGDKNLSTWSLRPWLAMTHLGIPFREENIRLDRPDSRERLKAASPSGLVPCLKDGAAVVWDSLAILEHLNDRFPDKNLWPRAPEARAHARSIAAEMHAGFSNLRTVWPMQVLRRDLRHLTSGGVARDIARIAELWTEARDRFGAREGGPFLYGDFSIADAMYAPVATRFRTYGPVELPRPAADWMETILETPAMKSWVAGAEAEVAADRR
ncbi:MAG: glutathione S-transferase [Alphaproteobacteria bacterium]|nr:glutathione S-transferase [Alphaproteobacteria bacterium]